MPEKRHDVCIFFFVYPFSTQQEEQIESAWIFPCGTCGVFSSLAIAFVRTLQTVLPFYPLRLCLQQTRDD